MASGSFVFEDEFLCLFHMFNSLLIAGHPEHSASLAEVAQPLNLENHSEMHAFHFLLIKSSFQHLISFCSIFSQFKEKLDTGKFFQVCHFLSVPEL
jgi:hypothetical protein